MTREQALEDLEKHFGADLVRRRPLANGDVMVAVGPLAVGTTAAATRIGLRLSATVTSQPIVYVDNLDLRLPGGGLPNNHREELVEGESWRTWSMQQLWTEGRPIYQLVLMVLERWTRAS